MNIISLFSGIGAFEKALTNLNKDFNIFNYCEFDKYSSESYSAIHNVDKKLNLGDITKVDITKLEKGCADLITYGFPCQDISIAGKQKGFKDEKGNITRSGLFFYATSIIGRIQPKIAIAENVKALTSKKFENEFATVLSSLEEIGYNNYYKVLNAKDYGIPQNRERVFIVSIRKDIDNKLFEFPKPFSLEKKLKDLLENEVDEKYYLSDKMLNYVLDINNIALKSGRNINNRVVNPNIAKTISCRGAADQRADVTNFVIDNIENEIKVKELKAFEPIACELRTDEGVRTFKDNLMGTLRTIDACGCKHIIEPNLKTQLCNQLVASGKIKDGDVFRHSYSTNRMNKFYASNKENHNCSPTLDTRCDCLGVAIKENTNIRNVMEDCATTLGTNCGSSTSSGGGVVYNNLRIRKLTPKECFRLMGFSDEDFEKSRTALNNTFHKGQDKSNAQLYKQAGNSIVVNVLMELFKSIYKANLL